MTVVSIRRKMWCKQAKNLALRIANVNLQPSHQAQYKNEYTWYKAIPVGISKIGLAVRVALMETHQVITPEYLW